MDAGTRLGGSPAPDFTLRDQFGQPRRLSGFRGRVVLLAFVGSRASATGPLTAQMLVDAKKLLGSAGKSVQLLAVNTDAGAPSVQAVATWSAAHGMTRRWLFLTGSKKQLGRVWRAYHVAVTVDPASGRPVATSATYVVGRAGRLRYLFLTDPNFRGTTAEAHALAERAAALLPGSVRVAPAGTLAPPRMPSRGAFSLPGLTPAGAATQVVVGEGGGPRLVDFFATWCHSCAEDLAQLDRYAASRRGDPALPAVVGVDLRISEPSTAWVRAFVRKQSVAFPVALDARGSVSDAYGVAALPTMAVVSGAGRILWRHVGVLPAPALTRSVRAALAGAG